MLCSFGVYWTQTLEKTQIWHEEEQRHRSLLTELAQHIAPRRGEAAAVFAQTSTRGKRQVVPVTYPLYQPWSRLRCATVNSICGRCLTLHYCRCTTQQCLCHSLLLRPLSAESTHARASTRASALRAESAWRALRTTPPKNQLVKHLF